MVQDWTSQLPDPMGKTRSQLCETDYRMSKCPQERTAILKSSDLIPKGEIAYSEWRQRLHQSSSEPSTPVPRAPRTHRSRRQKPWIPSSRPRIRIRCDAIAVDQSAAARISRTRALNPRLQNPTARKRGGRQAESAIVKQRIHPRHGEFEIRDPPVLNPFSTDRSISYNREKITSNSEKKNRSASAHAINGNDRSKSWNPNKNPTTIARKRGRGTDVYLIPNPPPRLLTTGRQRRAGREEAISRQDRRRRNPNETKRNEKGIGEGFRKPTSSSAPRLVAARTKRESFFFFLACCSPDRWQRGEGGRGGYARHRRRGGSKGAASTGPTCRRPRGAARRAVAFVDAKCLHSLAGDVTCVPHWQVGRKLGPHEAVVHARAWAGVFGRMDGISRPPVHELIHTAWIRVWVTAEVLQSQLIKNYKKAVNFVFGQKTMNFIYGHENSALRCVVCDQPQFCVYVKLHGHIFWFGVKMREFAVIYDHLWL